MLHNLSYYVPYSFLTFMKVSQRELMITRQDHDHARIGSDEIWCHDILLLMKTYNLCLIHLSHYDHLYHRYILLNFCQKVKNKILKQSGLNVELQIEPGKFAFWGLIFRKHFPRNLPSNMCLESVAPRCVILIFLIQFVRKYLYNRNTIALE